MLYTLENKMKNEYQNLSSDINNKKVLSNTNQFDLNIDLYINSIIEPLDNNFNPVIDSPIKYNFNPVV